jgi:hypothetical protein
MSWSLARSFTPSRSRSRGSPSIQASNPISHFSRLGVQRTLPIQVQGTFSSQTVCQMPVVRGYQIECGSSFQSCLPRGLARSAGSSSTRTTIVWGPPSTSRSVSSTEKGV